MDLSPKSLSFSRTSCLPTETWVPSVSTISGMGVPDSVGAEPSSSVPAVFDNWFASKKAKNAKAVPLIISAAATGQRARCTLLVRPRGLATASRAARKSILQPTIREAPNPTRSNARSAFRIQLGRPRAEHRSAAICRISHEETKYPAAMR